MTIPALRRALLACSLLSLLAAPGAPAAAAADSGMPVPCTTAQASFDAAQLMCDIAPASDAQWHRLQVAFRGVHDDSKAALGLHLDGREVTCTGGSRPRIEGEALGDTVSCRFEVPGGEAARKLRVQVIWYHAEPVSFALRKD